MSGCVLGCCRGGDVILLAERFLQRFNREVGARAQGFSDEALAAIRGHHWPGNVRELENTVQRAVILSQDSELITPAVLGLSFFGQATTVSTYTESRKEPGAGSDVESESISNETTTGGDAPPMELAEVEKKHILAVLEDHEGNRTRAADALKISVRTLRNKLNEYRESGDFDG